MDRSPSAWPLWAAARSKRSKRSKSDAEEEEEEKEGNLRSLSQTSAGSSKRRPSRPPPLRHHRSPLHAASGRAAEALPRPAAIDLRSAPPVTLTFPGFQLFDNPLHHLSARRSGIKPATSSGGAAHVIKAEPLSWRPPDEVTEVTESTGSTRGRTRGPVLKDSRQPERPPSPVGPLTRATPGSRGHAVCTTRHVDSRHRDGGGGGERVAVTAVTEDTSRSHSGQCLHN